MPGEQRRYSRYTVEGTGVNAKTMFNTEVEILDISIGGASISCARRLGIGAEYLFKFEHKDRLIAVKGQVVWARLTGTRKVSDDEAVPLYTFGVEFKDSSEKTQDLEEFMADEMGKVRERRLSSVRVKIHAPEKAVVSYTGDCSVIEMGMGGMRLEMNEAPIEGTLLTMEIVMPEGENRIECGGRVVFSYPVSDKPQDNRHSVGIEFTYISDEDRARLGRFMDSLPPDI